LAFKLLTSVVDETVSGAVPVATVLTNVDPVTAPVEVMDVLPEIASTPVGVV